MNKIIWGSVIGSVLILVMLVAVVPGMLKGQPEQQAQEEAVSVVKRPACPTPDVAGISLPCLGADARRDTPKLTVVNLWAWWCGPCRAELPLFDELATTHPEWNVVGVHADRNAANGAAMLDDLGISLPSYQDNSNQFAGTLALPSVVPITVVVREDGTVAKKFPKTFASVSELEAAINEVK